MATQQMAIDDQKALALGKAVLKSDGVLVVTIDEHEVQHLGVLLEELLPEHARQMVTIVINEKGVAQGRLSRAEEYAFFCLVLRRRYPPRMMIYYGEIGREKRFRVPRWEWLLRGGTNSRRQDRKQLFFPVFVDPDVPKITGFGEPLPFEQQPDLTPENEENCLAHPQRRKFWKLAGKPSNFAGVSEEGLRKAWRLRFESKDLDNSLSWEKAAKAN